MKKSRLKLGGKKRIKEEKKVSEKWEYINNIINNEGVDNGVLIYELIKAINERDNVTIKVIRGYLDSLALAKNWSSEGDIAQNIIDKYNLDKY